MCLTTCIGAAGVYFFGFSYNAVENMQCKSQVIPTGGEVIGGLFL
jgi:hypothetical protein